MCLYFLNEYITYREIPEKLVDVNIASDYNKIGNMLTLCKNENRLDIIEATVLGEKIQTDIVQKFNPSIEFGEKELVSMLYYLGYLTIDGERLGRAELKIPNQVMREIYADYFLKMLENDTNLKINEKDYNEVLEQMALEGKIDKIIEIMEKYLKNLSNRDFMNFDEKYIKVMFYSIAMSLDIYIVKSELELGRGYADLLLVPKDIDKDYYSIIIEFKYLKKSEENELVKKQKEAKEQIKKYSSSEEIKRIKKLNKYIIVGINDKLFVKEI